MTDGKLIHFKLIVRYTPKFNHSYCRWFACYIIFALLVERLETAACWQMQIYGKFLLKRAFWGLEAVGWCNQEGVLKLLKMFRNILFISVSSCLPEVHSIILGFKVKENYIENNILFLNVCNVWNKAHFHTGTWTDQVPWTRRYYWDVTFAGRVLLDKWLYRPGKFICDLGLDGLEDQAVSL